MTIYASLMLVDMSWESVVYGSIPHFWKKSHFFMENHTPMHFNLCDTYLNFALVLCVKLIQKPVKYKGLFY